MPDKGWRPCLSLISIYLRHAASCRTTGGGHAHARVRECAKAAILRSRCEFHGTRYHAAAGFVTERSGVSLKFRRMELLPVHAIHSPGDRLDRNSEGLLRRIKGATTLEEDGAVGKAFRD